MQRLTAAKIKNLIVSVLKEHQALDIEALNVKKLTTITDYMIIATATSAAHAKALANYNHQALAALKIKPLGTEEDQTREWILVDFGDVILHIMLEPMRKFYALEKLWGTLKTRGDTISNPVIARSDGI